MQHEQLSKIIEATRTGDNPILMQLLADLRRDPHIRTNDLEARFKQLAKDLGVEIIHEEVREATIAEQLSRFRPKLIIGADGTHSVVSRTLFSPDNQVKDEFDFVMQVRFEVRGDVQIDRINTINLLQQMGRTGLIANENVGRYDASTGTTPVTMQLMISKDDFYQLQSATSRNPIRPLSAQNNNNNGEITVPAHLKLFAHRYLQEKIKAARKQDPSIQIMPDTIRISVNEAPATHAQLATKFLPDDRTGVSLAGDSGLGLSYFKGLNAGLESTAKYLGFLDTAIQNNLDNPDELRSGFQQYQDWFEGFAARKIKEVESYSKWNIRAVMKGAKIVQAFKNASVAEHEDDALPQSLRDYFIFVKNPQLQNTQFRQYPHRDYDPVKLGQAGYVPLSHTMVKIDKLFVDYFKPYKSLEQVRQDFKQPLVGLNNSFRGVTRTLFGLVTVSPARISDGILTLSRGVIELATAPFAWIVKPITRGFFTVFFSPEHAENNAGTQRLVALGLHMLANTSDGELSPEQRYKLKAVCNDIHRKYTKDVQRSQSTLLKDERERYGLLNDDVFLSEKIKVYLTLFQKNNELVELPGFFERHAKVLRGTALFGAIALGVVGAGLGAGISVFGTVPTMGLSLFLQPFAIGILGGAGLIIGGLIGFGIALTACAIHDFKRTGFEHGTGFTEQVSVKMEAATELDVEQQEQQQAFHQEEPVFSSSPGRDSRGGLNIINASDDEDPDIDLEEKQQNTP